MGRKGLGGRIGVSEATLIHQHSAVSFAHVVSPLPTVRSSRLPCLHFALFSLPSHQCSLQTLNMVPHNSIPSFVYQLFFCLS